jgi:fructose-1-phosphate kinase PfkB-like protein
MPYLDELDPRGYRYYFQHTILGYPRELDPKTPPAATAVETFRELAERLGSSRMVWRYDPIVVTGLTPPAFHEENFQRLAESLRESTRRVVVSIVDMYRKIERRLKKLEGTPAAVRPTCPSGSGRDYPCSA